MKIFWSILTNKTVLFGLTILSLLLLSGCGQNAVPVKTYTPESQSDSDISFAYVFNEVHGPAFSFSYPSECTMADRSDMSSFTAYIKGPVLSSGVYGSPLITLYAARIGKNAPRADSAVQESISQLEAGTILDFGAITDLRLDRYPVLVGEIQGWEISAYFKILSSFTQKTSPAKLSDYDTSNEPLVALRVVFFDYKGYTYRISVISYAAAFDSALYEHIVRTFKILYAHPPYD
jgi:hypothetical protein